jgi:hypothetical protein
MTHDEYITGANEDNAPFNKKEATEFVCGDFAICYKGKVFCGYIDVNLNIPFSDLFDCLDAEEEEFDNFAQYIDGLSIDELMPHLNNHTAKYK